jgi:hypothetical protein
MIPVPLPSPDTKFSVGAVLARKASLVVRSIERKGTLLQPRKITLRLQMLGGLYIGTFLPSPLIENPSALLAAQSVSLALLLTGVSMWQWPRVTGTLRRMGGKS